MHGSRIVRYQNMAFTEKSSQFNEIGLTYCIDYFIFDEYHLYDEEREDFRAHLDVILNKPEEGWGHFSPFESVTARRYNERDLETSVQNFLAERRDSLVWLESLGTPDWKASMPAPWGGDISAGDMFASWVIHDQWHIQQLIQARRNYVIAQVAPYDVEYAGEL